MWAAKDLACETTDKTQEMATIDASNMILSQCVWRLTPWKKITIHKWTLKMSDKWNYLMHFPTQRLILHMFMCQKTQPFLIRLYSFNLSCPELKYGSKSTFSLQEDVNMLFVSIFNKKSVLKMTVNPILCRGYIQNKLKYKFGGCYLASR